MANQVKIKNPNALVFIYNYKDRLGDSQISTDPFEPQNTKTNQTEYALKATKKNEKAVFDWGPRGPPRARPFYRLQLKRGLFSYYSFIVYQIYVMLHHVFINIY